MSVHFPASRFLGGLLCTAVLAIHSSVPADCGSIPFHAPLLSPVVVGAEEWSSSGEAPRDLEVDSLKVSVFEPKQRALILWNGQEQILLLSTDQKASRKSHVLEVIPLPSQPAVRLGSFSSFEEAQKLVVSKRMWAVAHAGGRAGDLKLPESAGRITFAKKMGAHNLAVAEVLSASGFVEYVQDYLRQRYGTPSAPIRPEMVRLIETYLDAGFRWFAFDVIELDDQVKSREPVEYRFRSDKVFYPLRISSLEEGPTEAEMLVLTRSGLTQFEDLPARAIERQPVVRFTREELTRVEPQWKDFFGPGETEVVVDQWKIQGRSSELKRDVVAR